MYLLLFVLLRGSQFFQSEPPLIIARETTYITEPLRPDGLPDYEAYLRSLGRQGVTLDNNAAVLIWQVLWPNNLEQEDMEAMRIELGLKELPSSEDALQLLGGKANQKRITEWLCSDDDFEAKDLVWPAADHAWTSKEYPPLAEWVSANRRPLDLLIAASRRPRFYSPSPSYLNGKRDLLVSILLPGSQNMREVSRALGARAMQHVGENRLDDAWTDVLAVHRLSRLNAQGQTVVDQLVSIAMSDVACRGTLAIMSSERMPLELAKRIKSDLESLPRICHMAQCFDEFERLSGLDGVICLKQHGILRGVETLSEIPPRGADYTRPFSFDANAVMLAVNGWYDRLVAIARMPPKFRKEAYERLFAELEQNREQIKKPWRLAAAVISQKARNSFVSTVLVNLMLPALDVANAAEDRAHTTLELTRFSAALNVYRAKYGRYPELMDELVPSVLAKLPVDLFHAKPFFYKRIDTGYLLYTAGPNGQDDGGSNEQQSIYAGHELDDYQESEAEPLRAKIPSGADDFSIRVPRPPLKPWPTEANPNPTGER